MTLATNRSRANSADEHYADHNEAADILNRAATLGTDGKLLSTQMPAIPLGDTFTVASQAAMLALAANHGDMAIRTDPTPDEFYILTSDSPAILADWKQINLPAAVLSVDGLVGAVNLVGTYIRPAAILLLSDSQATKQAKLDAAGAGAVVVMERGVHTMPFVSHTTAGYFCCLRIPSKVTLDAYGATIKLADNQTQDVGAGDACSIIYNSVLTGGDEDIHIRGLTVDGNAANQTGTHNGITFTRTRGARCTDVRVKNVRGTSNVPPNETFAYNTELGTDTTYTRCVAECTAGSTGSGFAANDATNPTWTDCTGRGMTHGHGFAAWQCVSPRWSGCSAYLNGDIGFNCEESLSASFLNCHAGGQAALGSDAYPLAAGTTMGNAGTGFVLLGSAGCSLTNCTSRRNGGAGLVFVEGIGAYGPCSGRVVACNFADNAYGVSVGTSPILKRWVFGADSTYTGNVHTAFDIPLGWQAGPGGHTYSVGHPAVAATGVAVDNPFPWPVNVYIDGGVTDLRRINGFDVGNDASVLRLEVGDSVTLFYSSAPTWIWFPA